MKSQTVITQIVAIETMVPMISARFQPYVRWSFTLRWPSQRAIIEMAKPIMSEARCAESAIIAIEPAQ